jgi:two-component system phosphate regulon response regulator OmpR
MIQSQSIVLCNLVFYILQVKEALISMAGTKAHILVVDDDDRLRALLKRFLREQGFMVTVAADADEACRKLSHFLFDLMILDVMMPGRSGLELLAELKEKWRMPVLMLSAMGESEDRIRGLEIGAEDYVTKPFEPKELVLRIRAILRRAQVLPQTKVKTISFGEYYFDLSASQLKRGSENIALTSGEMAILKLLAENAGKPVSREELARAGGGGNERTVDVQITRLRKKIEESEGKPVYLQTVRGSGYVLYAQGEAS